MPPAFSLTAMTVAPRASSRRAVWKPTLPKPCTATRMSVNTFPCVFRNLRRTFMTPRPVASSRPTEPPMLTGLPVTTPSAW
jgi:hypothetical protein